MPPQSLRFRTAVVLTAALVSLAGILLAAPASFGVPADEEYGCVLGCEPGPSDDEPEPGPGAESGGGSDSGGAGDSAGGGSRSGGGRDAGSSAKGGGSGPSSGPNSTSDSSFGFGDAATGAAAGRKASKALDGRSLGEVLAGGTDGVAKPTAATNAGTRAAQNVDDGGGNALLWLLLALGAITAVAAGGVAVRRRQARQGYAAG